MKAGMKLRVSLLDAILSIVKNYLVTRSYLTILIYNPNSARHTVLLLFMCVNTTTTKHNGLIGLLYYIKTTRLPLLKRSQTTFVQRSGSDGT